MSASRRGSQRPSGTGSRGGAAPSARKPPASTAAVRVHVLHGPNLNLLGERDPAIYGTTTLAEIDAELSRLAHMRGAIVRSFQSNLEGELVNRLHAARRSADAVIINPGGYTHTSVAIRDAIDAIGIPVVEVHLSNLYRREPIRHVSVTAAACVGVISGFAAQSYYLGLDAALRSVEGLRQRHGISS